MGIHQLDSWLYEGPHRLLDFSSTNQVVFGWKGAKRPSERPATMAEQRYIRNQHDDSRLKTWLTPVFISGSSEACWGIARITGFWYLITRLGQEFCTAGGRVTAEGKKLVDRDSLYWIIKYEGLEILCIPENCR